MSVAKNKVRPGAYHSDMKFTRRSVAALLSVGLAGLALSLLTGVPTAEGRYPRAVTLDRAAEWGVWKVRAGHVTSLEELAAELPPFVHRGRPSATPTPTAPVPYHPDHPVQARKPVLYLYSSRSLNVRVQVGLPVGGQTLHYPGATQDGSGLVFTGRLDVAGSGAPSRLRRAPARHFWNALRRVPASYFTSFAGEAERFIFYDGLTDLRTPFVFYGAGDHGSVDIRRDVDILRDRQSEGLGDDVVYAVHAGRYRRVAVTSGSPASLAQGTEQPIRGLEAELRAQLVARGLTREEAQSLLTTWHHDLFQASGDRRIYFVDRVDYDAMLPIQILPRPLELVRVGLVIDLP